MPVTTVSWPVSTGDVLRHRCEELMAAEMARLARRAPALHAAHLREVQAAFGRIIEELVLSRADAVHADQLALLFDLPGIRQ